MKLLNIEEEKFSLSIIYECFITFKKAVYDMVVNKNKMKMNNERSQVAEIWQKLQEEAKQKEMAEKYGILVNTFTQRLRRCRSVVKTLLGEM